MSLWLRIGRWFWRKKSPTRAETQALQQAELRVRSAELGLRQAHLELKLALRERGGLLNG